MAQVITTGAHPKGLWPGVKDWFGREYRKHPEIWKQLFTITSSDKSFEEVGELTGFGYVPVKPEGDAIRYDSEQQGYITRYTNVTYGMGWIATREAKEDMLYEKIAKRRSSALAFSAQTTKETVHANVFNRAFNSSYVGGDGVEMISDAHPTLNGTQSNELATPADLSEAALEDLIVMMMNAQNSRGLPIALSPKKLVVPSNYYFDARRILESELQNDTANNAKNIVNSMLDGYVCWKSFLTDADAWFVTTDCPEGLTHMRRRSGEFTQDNDFDSENAKAKYTERYSCGWTDWRGIYGSSGS